MFSAKLFSCGPTAADRFWMVCDANGGMKAMCANEAEAVKKAERMNKAAAKKAAKA